MESPLAGLFLRQLLSHNSHHGFRRASATLSRIGLPRCQSRPASNLYSGGRERDDGKAAWTKRVDTLPVDRMHEYAKYDMFTAEELRRKRRRPRRMKMLLRDFIEDSLYNPEYGYFSSSAVIFNPGEPFDFNSMRNEAAFHRVLGERYAEFEDTLDKTDFNDTRQLWHTPTELFRPHYAEAVARNLVAQYRLGLFPWNDLIIYELGAGNGTFMLNVLDYIYATDPEVYARTQYKVIEISSSLAQLQSSRLNASSEPPSTSTYASLSAAAAHGHASKVQIINQSIFNWTTYVSSPCFVLALEVIDNFAHDVLRYSPHTEDPLQGTVLIDAEGEMYQFFTPKLDPVAARFMRVRDAACASFPLQHPLRWSRWKRAIRSKLPLAPNLSDEEYIPTRLMQFFDVLQRYFPAHKLLVSDFHSLPNAISGVNAPVVQTRYQRRTVPVSTPLVRPGYFDILFPTDFNVAEAMYRAITGKLTRVMSHEEFMRRWAYVEDTQTRNGDNPLLSYYKNASFLMTV